VPTFSRKTIIAAVATMGTWSHTEINRFVIEYGLEGTDALAGSSKLDRANTFILYLLRNPTRPAEEGGTLLEVVVRDLIDRAASGHPEMVEFETYSPDLARALKRDGFDIVRGELRLAPSWPASR